MAALPYMQLYVADYLADTAHLTTMEHGAYLLLMFNYWQRGESFKAKDQQSLNKRLATVARLSISEWEEVRETLEDFFEVTETEWSHRRIDRDLETVNAKSSKAKAAGKASAQRRSNVRSANVEQTLNHTDTDTDTDTELNPSHTRADVRDEPAQAAQESSVPAQPNATITAPTAGPHLMTLDWEPDQRRLQALAARAGLPMSLFAQEAIAGFVIHHEAKGLNKTSNEWLAALIGWIKRDAEQAKAGASRAGNVRPFPARQGAEAVDFDTHGWLEGAN